jgi:hypothetical protein
MTPRQFYEANDRARCTEVAVAAGTNFANFQQIALYGGGCSPSLAERLEVASGKEMTRLEILYPDSQVA